MTNVRIRIDDLSDEATRGLIAFHLDGMRDTSPPESVHALDLGGLQHPDVTFWSAWIDGEIAGIAALTVLDADRGELKSMRVADGFRGTGVGRMLLKHALEQARTRGLTSVWLETGSTAEFFAAQRLYENAGFVRTGPFDDYAEDPFSVFMTLVL